MSYLFCFLGGQLVKKTGLIPDPKGPYLYLINHQSSLTILHWVNI